MRSTKKSHHLGVVLLELMLISLGVADALGDRHHAALGSSAPIHPAGADLQPNPELIKILEPLLGVENIADNLHVPAMGRRRPRNHELDNRELTGLQVTQALPYPSPALLVVVAPAVEDAEQEVAHTGQDAFGWEWLAGTDDRYSAHANTSI